MASVQAEGPCYRCTSPWLTCWLTVSGGRSVGSTATSKSITDSCTGARRISRRSGRHPRRRIRLLLTTTINRTAPTAVMMTMTASTPVHHHLPLRHHVSTPWSKSHFPLSSHLIFRRLSRTLNDAQLPRFISSFVIKTFFFFSYLGNDDAAPASLARHLSLRPSRRRLKHKTTAKQCFLSCSFFFGNEKKTAPLLAPSQTKCFGNTGFVEKKMFNQVFSGGPRRVETYFSHLY